MAKPKTLLLADGSSTIQRVVELTFAGEDIRVVSVDDGEQALQSIERDEPDIVLADVGMPRLDGYSVSSQVKTSPQWQHIPVLLLAGAFEPIDGDRARAARCDGVLVKPFEPRQLVSRVHELLEAAHARQAVAASARVAPVGSDGASSTGEATRVVLAWPKQDRTDTRERPAAPSFDVADLDRRLAALTPAPVVETMQADPTPAVAPPPEALILDPVSAAASPGAHAALLVEPEPPATEPPPRPVLMPERDAPAAVFRPQAPAATQAAQAAQSSQSTQTMAPAGGSLASKVSLATAFAALLAAEQSAPIGGGGSVTPGQSAVEDVVRRVLLSDGALRKIVLDAAERMVKEEIDRIKSMPGSPAEGGPLTE
jgi:CheY-like chemotaxis protein